ELDPVAPGERQHHLRLQGAFDVDVQLAFRQLRDEAAGIGHRGSPPSPAVRERALATSLHYEGILPSTPSASQFMPSTSLSGSTSPSLTLSAPFWSLIGPLKIAILPSLMPSSAAWPAEATSSGMLRNGAICSMPEAKPPQTSPVF